MRFKGLFVLPAVVAGLFLIVPAAAQSPTIAREVHWAVTEEKFELALERLRGGGKARHRVPVVLASGLFVNSRFLNLPEDYSLAGYLAREGFDVWNLSYRGSGRSLPPLQGGPKVWTMDDMIDRDVIAVNRYIRAETRSRRLSWVGFEMGALLLYGYLQKERDPALNLVALGAPVTFNHPAQEPMKKLLGFEDYPTLKTIFLKLNMPFVGRLLISSVPQIETFFYNPDNVDDEVKERFLEEALSEVNPGLLDHLLLMVKRGEFVSADGRYNYKKNLDRIRTPLLLIGGEKDGVAPPQALRDVHRAVRSPDRTLKIFAKAEGGTPYGHFDLIMGRKAQGEVYPLIGRWLRARDGHG